MILLCLSDIHGDIDALAAVLATAERRSFHKLLVAGDIVFPGPLATPSSLARASALETWRRLTSAGAVMVQGVTDRALATLDPKDLPTKTEHERRMVERVRATRAELGDLVLERIKRLPTHVRIPLEDGGELLLVHGSPSDPSEAMTHDMTDEELDALLGDDPADLVVCGMSHVPFDRTVAGVRIVNVGSVGEAPRAGDEPFANATWITSTASGVQVETMVVPLGSAEKIPQLMASR
jgi:predicted phosphodiesterase